MINHYFENTSLATRIKTIASLSQRKLPQHTKLSKSTKTTLIIFSFTKSKFTNPKRKTKNRKQLILLDRLQNISRGSMADTNFSMDTFDASDEEDIHLRWTKWITRFKRYCTHIKITESDAKINSFDQPLFRKHFTVSKANRMIGLMKHIFSSRSIKIWKKLYTTYIRPQVKFANSSWYLRSSET